MARREYPTEFRQQLIALVQAGRTPESLAKEFEPSAQTIRNWAAQAVRCAYQTLALWREPTICFSSAQRTALLLRGQVRPPQS
ncbi:MAG: transposase [Gemmatimonadales bacterium]|nr:transposase [Gemmatimonadales bacterium]